MIAFASISYETIRAAVAVAYVIRSASTIVC